MFELFVEGEPRPKQSFKISRHDNRFVGYTPKAIKDWSDVITAKAKLCNVMVSGLLKVELMFYLSNKRKVDCDNLSKLVLDALQGVVYKNDSSVVDLHIIKRVNKQCPGVLIRISEVDNEEVL